ncbi:hypothetical protein SAMN05660297_02927 [Natronincola peptidivorans]|uniref:Uncharacterized protein n=1 Tax=Natronincola peptidivorans TaxID=426128 RepID=A0A1I0FSE7_9FIRM|nr:hypothetical protein [Natronincola peptidivorans]SET61340.1 hypothetical protein SAMN05660297_02927 [Natronincola peptidivorans]
MFKLDKIKRFMPFIMGIIIYQVVTKVLNFLDKNTGVIRFTAFAIALILYGIAVGLYERKQS